MKILVITFLLHLSFIRLQSDSFETAKEACRNISFSSVSDCTEFFWERPDDSTIGSLGATVSCCFVSFRASNKYYSMCEPWDHQLKSIKKEVSLLRQYYSDVHIECSAVGLNGIAGKIIWALLFLLLLF